MQHEDRHDDEIGEEKDDEDHHPEKSLLFGGSHAAPSGGGGESLRKRNRLRGRREANWGVGKWGGEYLSCFRGLLGL